MKDKVYSVLLFISVSGIALLLCWYIFSPTYTFTYHKIPYCNKVLTIMEIDGFSRRQVAFISGEYHERHLPEKDFILKDKPSGFDAYFACIPTCDTAGKITVNYYEDFFIPTKYSDLIVSKYLSSQEYSGLLMGAAYHPEAKIY